uniref:Variant surface glycoprotein 1125.2117 n=2 Tax=Trypanosoma brucei TaxID=5691 RepID=A0A1J0R7V8_9TRYP|nr:variant surface glycoprotein 1125.2117 [Trypanosoma brucei]
MQHRKHKAYGTITTAKQVAGKATDADLSCIYTNRLTQVGNDACPEPSSYHTDLRKASYDPKGTTTLPVPSQLFFEQLKATVTGYKKGGHHSNVVPQESTGRCSDAAGTATSLDGTSGLGVQIEFTAEAANPTKDSIYSNKDTKTCVQKPNKIITHADRIAQLQAVVCAAVKDLPQKPKDLEAYTVTELKADSDMANIAKAILQGRSASKLDDSKMNQAAVDKVIIELFGTADNSFSENYIKKLKSQRLRFRTAGEQRKESAITAIEANTIGQALVYYTAKIVVTPKVQETEKPQQIASDNECKGENDEGKCNKKDGCEYKDGKCKLKEGVKVESDGKTTNTTGSNSFVIKKAPLWLAVLLI